MKTFERLESRVRGYCRSFPAVFTQARGSELTDEQGRTYIDFFSGAGVMSYGHNHPDLKLVLFDYLAADGIVHGLDMATAAKRRFLGCIEQHLLRPRNLTYKVQFPGPTGTNAVEAALKLARKYTGRERIVSFTNAFHGMTLGSLAVTGNASKRASAGVTLGDASVLPYDGYMGESVDTLELLETMLEDAGSGIDKPAAAIVETVQGEGGVNVAAFDWLRRLHEILKRHDVLLIVDDIQVGCGRTGPFFSFEPAGIEPDIVCLSKALSGFGLPLAVNLIRPEIDVWSPGEHNGTFRGNNPAFVTGAAALELFWRDDTLEKEVQRKAARTHERLEAIAGRVGVETEVRGRGLIQGIAFAEPEIAQRVSGKAFQEGLLIETSGGADEVLKLLPPLTVEDEDLDAGLDIIERCVESVTRAGSDDRARFVA